MKEIKVRKSDNIEDLRHNLKIEQKIYYREELFLNILRIIFIILAVIGVISFVLGLLFNI